ncbi:phosphoribosylglycinamide formyltransferase [Desulfovibrio litoralis]|uniref:Phosphoribosylglycinamide formyltransferase n=1 Tax=Desulfovibrio litoralis DSM 11393 TaxID=1121455 RepID=A0A1M7TD91_9BACT|nr:phosphoribosylglycinamide formyltransferase [Desulfovibrio litoralis]SHN68637.1 formyltetrahydrofolate-dependent phosphoribosylglycinamide formyltransferase [Desulfovibrio litoralis DSM 11393]
MTHKMPAVVLASGNGSNLQTLIDLKSANKLDLDIKLVVSNNPEAFALERAKNAKITTWGKSHKSFESREAFDLNVIAEIEKAGILSNQKLIADGKDITKSSQVGCIILAGYMRLLSTAFIQAFSGRILNIHPALLPSFAGAKGGLDALNYGIKITGCTVHFVDEIMDHGPVIIQAAVPHKAGESLDELMQRIHKLEHRIYPQAVQWLAEDRLSLKDRVVYLKENSKSEKLASLGNQELSFLVSPPLEKF